MKKNVNGPGSAEEVLSCCDVQVARKNIIFDKCLCSFSHKSSLAVGVKKKIKKYRSNKTNYILYFSCVSFHE